MVLDEEKDVSVFNPDSFYNRVCKLGRYLFGVLITMINTITGAVKSFFANNSHHLNKLLNGAGAFFKEVGKHIAKPFIRYAKAINLGKADILRAKRDEGTAGAVRATLKFIGRIIFGKRGIAVTVCNYTLPVISAVFLFNIITYANNMEYALKLNVNGEFVGYISDETTFGDAERIVQQRINYVGNSSETVSFEPRYEIEKIGYGSTLTKYQLADKMLVTMGAEIENAYGLYIGNSFYGAVVDKEPVEATLDSLLDEYRTGAKNEVVDFEREITYEPGLYLKGSIVNEDSLITLLKSKRSVASYYTAVEDDYPNLIAEKLNMSLDELASLNPGLTEESEVYVGDKFLIKQDEPFLAVTVTRTEMYNEPTSFKTEYQNDSTRYQGTQVTIQDGEEGIDRITANVSYINGVETKRQITVRETIKKPVSKVIALGTKEVPPNTQVSVQNVEVGQMYWPVGENSLISEMMYGYGGYYNHGGIDISAPYGTPVFAADSGTVIRSSWYADYGYCVMIQHSNGIVTVYGHCSYLHVNVGDWVTQGQQIADVGATGRASGNHCHFEVRINGVCMNPINYLPWHQRAPWCVEY